MKEKEGRRERRACWRLLLRCCYPLLSRERRRDREIERFVLSEETWPVVDSGVSLLCSYGEDDDDDGLALWSVRIVQVVAIGE